VNRLGDVDEPSDSDEESSENNDDKTTPKVDKATLRTWATKNMDRVVERRTVEGLVRTVEDLDYDDSKLYKALGNKVAPQPVLLEEGVTPANEGNGALEIGFATVLLAISGMIALYFVSSIVTNLNRRAEY
jgi:hypothetical protein